MPKKDKVCFVYKKDGEIHRTRFFKATSTFILKRVKKSFQDRGIRATQMTRTKWEIEHGPINEEPSPLHTVRDLKFKSKTTSMKNWPHKQYFEFIYNL